MSSSGSSRRIWALPGIALACGGIALTFIRRAAGTDGVPEGWWADAAFGAPFVVAGLVGLGGLICSRPAFIVAAGVAVMPIAMVSPVMWPLWLPAGAMVARGAAQMDDAPRSELLHGGAIGGILVVAFFALLVHDDPASWQNAQASGSTGDIVTGVEAAISLLLTATSGAVAAVALSPKRMRKGPAG